MSAKQMIVATAVLVFANSPTLADPPQSCEFEKRVADFSIHHIRRGLDKANFWTVHPIPANWSEKVKATTMAIVEAAYLWPRGEQDFVDQTFRDCLGREVKQWTQ